MTLRCWLFGHQDGWPFTEAGLLKVQCARCHRVSAGWEHGEDDIRKEQRLKARLIAERERLRRKPGYTAPKLRRVR